MVLSRKHVLEVSTRIAQINYLENFRQIRWKNIPRNSLKDNWRNSYGFPARKDEGFYLRDFIDELC